jgi:hypothetical protein
MRGGDRFRGQRPHHRRVVIEHEDDEPFVMSRESKILEKAMSDVGYECVQLDVYKAAWSSPGVEHFIYFSRYGQREEFFRGHCGMRNPRVEDFSVSSIRAYGGEFLYNSLDYDVRTSCTMRFPFDRLTPSEARWSLNRLKMSSVELAATVQDFVKERVSRAVADIVDADRFLSFLAADLEPCPWIVSNGAIRAAQIVALAIRTGIDTAQIGELLKSRESHISRGFVRESMYREKPAAYIDNIVADARRLFGAAKT